MTLRIRLAGKLTALAAPGGGETQLSATAQALRECGVDARLWRPWEEGFDQIDCLHLFGSESEHLNVMAAARSRGIPVVLSTIAWFDLASRWRSGEPLRARLNSCGKFLLRAAAPRLPSWRRRLYDNADMLLPNSQAEADQLTRYFGTPRDRIAVVPNGADPRFAHAAPDAFSDVVPYRGFALYAGRIEPRKNQLGFLKAMQGSHAPIVILGDAAPGHEDYLRRCRQAAGSRTRFVSRMAHDDPLLASAYASCGCLVLASWFETPGLVALEAGLLGVPLVLTERGAAREYFGDFARYINPASAKSIRVNVLEALSQERNTELAQHVEDNFTWRAVAHETLAAYDRVTKKEGPVPPPPALKRFLSKRSGMV